MVQWGVEGATGPEWGGTVHYGRAGWGVSMSVKCTCTSLNYVVNVVAYPCKGVAEGDKVDTGRS